MVAINEILLSECTVEGRGGDTGICTDSRVQHHNTENRVPATRNHRRIVATGRWLTRDPIGYRGGINIYGYVNSSPVGNVDACGLHLGFGRLTGAIGYGIFRTVTGVEAVGHAVGQGVADAYNATTSALGGGIYAAGSAARRAAAYLRRLPAAVIQAKARTTYCAHCAGKSAKAQGAYVGINLAGDAGAFDPLGGIGIAGLQAIVICSSRQLALYAFGGGEAGVGTPFVAGLAVGPTGGYGLSGAKAYTGWFEGGQFQAGPLSGGLYRSTDGAVSNWNLGRNFGPGASLTTGAEDYFLLKAITIGGGPNLCCGGRSGVSK